MDALENQGSGVHPQTGDGFNRSLCPALTVKGHAFGEDTVQQQEFENFPFEETEISCAAPGNQAY